MSNIIKETEVESEGKSWVVITQITPWSMGTGRRQTVILYDDNRRIVCSYENQQKAIEGHDRVCEFLLDRDPIEIGPRVIKQSDQSGQTEDRQKEVSKNTENK